MLDLLFGCSIDDKISHICKWMGEYSCFRSQEFNKDKLKFEAYSYNIFSHKYECGGIHFDYHPVYSYSTLSMEWFVNSEARNKIKYIVDELYQESLVIEQEHVKQCKLNERNHCKDLSKEILES